MSIKSHNIGEILDLPLNSRQKKRVLASVRNYIAKNTKSSIFTLNPEIVNYACDMPDYYQALKKCKNNVPDGTGLLIAQEFLGLKRCRYHILDIVKFTFQGIFLGLESIVKKRKVKPIKGRELFLDICKIGNRLGWKIFLLGGEDDEVSLTAEKLRFSLKKLKINFEKGPILTEKGLPKNKKEKAIEAKCIQRINKFSPNILFVGFGAPKQEYWIDKWLPKLKVNVAMGVGGTFNYISGKVKLPPNWMEKAGLEWLWRLITQPRRLKRIFNALVVFPLRVYKYKLQVRE